MRYLLTFFVFLTTSSLFAQTFTKVSFSAFETMTDAKADWADFNNDGLPDLFVAGTNASGTHKVCVYFNNGDETFNTLNLVSWEAVSFDIGDYNQDGYLDILMSGKEDSGAPIFQIFKNNSGSSFTAQAFGLTNIAKGGVRWADFDFDGDLDIVASGLNASFEDQVLFYRYDENASSYTSVSLATDLISLGEVDVLDANNDGVLEVLFTGLNDEGDASSLIYSIDKDWTIALYSDAAEGYAFNGSAFGDYNEDGFLDLALTGFTQGSPTSSDLFTNNGTSYTTVTAFLQDLSSAEIAFADLDNDGLLDILLCGANSSTFYFQYYQNVENAGAYTFSTVSHAMENIYDGDMAVADYDLDGDLDVFQIGNSNVSLQSNLYASDAAATTVNNAPNVPALVSAVSKGDSVTLNWNTVTDDLTHANSITYNVYVSENGGGSDLYLSPHSDVTTGYRRVAMQGNTGVRTSLQLHDLPEGNYYWSTQAIDGNFKGSAFATEGEFTVCHPVTIGNDTTICQNESVTLSVTDPEATEVNWYSITDGLMEAASFTYDHLAGQKDTVIAEVTKSYGCVRYDTLIVSVYDLPYFNLGQDTTICYGEFFDLSVTELGITGLDRVNWYSRNLGKLLDDSEELTFEVLEKDTLIAEVFNINGCVHYDSLIVSVYDLPDYYLGNDTTLCYGDLLYLSVTDLGITGLDSVNWYSMDQGTLMLDSEVLSYEVLEKDTLIAEVFNVNGCINYDSLIVSVYDLPIFNLRSDVALCYGAFLDLSVSDLGIIGLDSANWYSIDQGTLRLNSEELSYEVLEKDTLITEVFNINGCVNYDSLVVSSYDLASFNLGNDTTICQGEFFDLSVTDLGVIGLDSVNWYSMDQGTLVLDNEDLRYEVLERDTLIVEVYNVSNCVNYDSLVVSVFDLPAYYLGNDTTICYGEYIDLSVTDLGIDGMDSVNWYSTVSGSLLEDSEALSYEVLEKDTLIAEVFNVNGCVNYDSLIVSMYDLPDYYLGNDTTICYGEFFDLSVTDLGIDGFDSVNWYSTGLGSLLEDSEALSYEVLEKDTLIAEVFNVNGCVNYDSLIVSMYDLPAYYLGNDTTICYGEYIVLSVTDLGIDGLDSVNWYSTELGSLLENSETLSYEVLVQDTLIAEVFNVNGCVNYDSLIVSVYDLPAYYLRNDTTICYGEFFDLSVTDLGIDGLDSVNWYSMLLGTLLEDSEALSYEVLEKDTLITEVFNVNGCVNYDTLIVSVYDLPTYYLGNDTTICYGQFFDLSLTGLGIVGLDSVNWYSTGLGSLLEDSEDLSYEVLVKDTLIAEVFNVNGCVNYDSLIISVFDLPVFDIGNDTSLCYGSSLILRTGVLYDEVNWYALEQEETLVENSWFYTHTALFTDTLLAEVYDLNRCLNYDTIAIKMNLLPDHTIGDDLSICSEDTAYLAVSGSWPEVHWLTVEDQILKQESPTYRFKVEETMTLWTEVFSDEGCVQYDTITVTELALPVFDLPEEEIYCFGDSIKLAVEVANLFEWRGGQGLLSSDQNWSTKAVDSDIVSLYLEDENACHYSDTMQVTVNQLPVFNIEGAVEICLFDSTDLIINYELLDSIHWYTDNGSMLYNENAIYFGASQTTWVYADLVDVNQCLSSDSVQVVVHGLPQALAGNDSLICTHTDLLLGQEYTEEDWIYYWTPVTSLTEIESHRPTAAPDTETTYYLDVENQEGCHAFDTVVISVNPAIEIFAGEDLAICMGDKVSLGGEVTASGSQFDYEYSWTSTAHIGRPSQSNPTITPASTADYFLAVTSSYCPTEYDTIKVVVNDAPEITVSPQQSVGANESVVLEATGGVEYLWTPENSLDDGLLASPEATPLETTTYSVLVTDSNGCQNSGEVQVLVQNVIFIPNLFTPNGDNNNDTFMVYGSGIADINFQVYDVKGNMVYRSNDVMASTTRGWDGNYKGKPAPNGTYLWSISGSFHDGSALKFEGEKKGTIKLIR
ncbi:MAG: FG-GAP-like repeat-containing protein [Reichenbachiella sp.]